MDRIWILALKEWRDGWRNRWVIGVTILFAMMSLGITWFGGVVNGQSGTIPLDATITSLSSLTVLVIPLIALLLGYDAFVGEKEQGTLLLLLTYPISKRQLVLGKFAGQLGILSVATIIGFGSAALLMMIESFSWDMLRAFSAFIFSAVLLGAVFIAMAHLLSLLVAEKAQAAGLALMVWFVFTLLYDLALLAMLVTSNGWLADGTLKALLLFNPTDLFRMANLIHLDVQGQGTLASIGQLDVSAWSLFALLLVWIAGCLTLSTIRFSHAKA